MTMRHGHSFQTEFRFSDIPTSPSAIPSALPEVADVVIEQSALPITVARRPSTEKTFFERKRPWSKMKDAIVGPYMPPYLTKVVRRGAPIELVDAFAGRGIYGDGSLGSPLLILEAAMRHVPGRFQATFINRNLGHHAALQRAVEQRQAERFVTCRNANAEDVLPELARAMSSRPDTLFMYLDPFGPSKVPFDVLEPFLQRPARFSTEIVVVLNVATLFRMAGSQQHHATLSRVLNTDEWQRFLDPRYYRSEEDVNGLVGLYADQLRKYGFLVGTCPIRKRPGLLANFFVISMSRHADALLLMNDIMYTAYNQFLGAATPLDLFASAELLAQQSRFDAEVHEILRQSPGIRRVDAWLACVTRHFRRYHSTAFRAAVRRLADAHELRFVSATGRLNDDAQLFLVNPGMQSVAS